MLALYLSLIDNDEEKNKFEQIYFTYQKRMLYVANSLLHDQYESEDAVQNAFIGIARNIQKIDEVNSKRTFSYVTMAAYNSAYNLLLKTKKSREYINIDDLNTLADNSFLDNIINRDDYDTIIQAIKNMDKIYRDVLLLHYVKGLTAKQIAEILDRKSGTVTQQIVRGKKILLDILEKGEQQNGNDK